MILLIAESNPDIEYNNLHMKPTDAAVRVFSMVEMQEARVLTVLRAWSFFPSFHNENAYTCRPSMSSMPGTTKNFKSLTQFVRDFSLL